LIPFSVSGFQPLDFPDVALTGIFSIFNHSSRAALKQALILGSAGFQPVGGAGFQPVFYSAGFQPVLA